MLAKLIPATPGIRYKYQFFLKEVFGLRKQYNGIKVCCSSHSRVCLSGRVSRITFCLGGEVMKLSKALVFALLLILVSCVFATADPDDERMPQDLRSLAITDTKPWSRPLMPVLQAAARKYDVPVALLLALGYFGSNFENRGGAPTIEGGYGVMALRDNWHGAKSLVEGASKTASTAHILKIDPAANIRAAAAVLDSYATEMGIDLSLIHI